METKRQLINVKIADRRYPIYIDPAQEEAVRKAEVRIKEIILAYQGKIKDRDMQDAMSMTLLKIAIDLIEKEMDHEYADLLEDLKNMNGQLEEYIASKEKSDTLIR